MLASVVTSSVRRRLFQPHLRTFRSTAKRSSSEPFYAPARDHFSRYSSQYINIGWSFLAFGLGIQVVRADREKKAAQEEAAVACAQLEEAASKAGSGFGAEERAALAEATWARTVVNSIDLAGKSEEERAQALISAIQRRVDDVGKRRARQRLLGDDAGSRERRDGGSGQGGALAAQDDLKPPRKRVNMV